MKMTLFKAASVAFFIALSSLAQAQNSGTVTSHAFAVGRGAGVMGYTSLLCTSAQLAVGQAAADPICRTITGDVTIDATGATAIGASKVTNAQIATMLANTTKCNATGGTTNPTDCTAATMRTNLALVPGTNIEAWDADLDALAALAGTGIARRTGANTWSVGTAVSNAELATMLTNTVKGNATSGTAVPTDLAVPSCSTASSALTWTTNTGFGCNAIAVSGTPPVPGGRLTPSSGTCVPTSDVVAAATVYYAPCVSPYVTIYNGVSVQAYNFTASVTDTVGLSLVLGSNWAPSTLYDMFITVNAGNPVPCSVAWTSSAAGTSSRATALAAYTGMQTNGAAIAACRTNNTTTIAVSQYQGTYVGTFLTSGSAGQVDLKFGSDAAGGGAAVASIWNAYNQIIGSFVVRDTNTNWLVTAASTYQPLDVSGTGSGLNNRVTFVQGLQGSAIDATLGASLFAATGNNLQIGIGLNVTNAMWNRCFHSNGGPAGASQVVEPAATRCMGYGPVGLNYLQGIQFSTSTSAAIYAQPGGVSYSQSEALIASWSW